MKRILLFLFVGAAFCLTGCFTVDTAKVPASNAEHMLISNYGWQLFNCIPLFCGNAYNGKDRSGEWAFFRDDVTMEKVQGRFMEYAKSKGKEAHDLSYHNYETVLFTIPMGGISIPIPYIICFKEIQLSGVVK